MKKESEYSPPDSTLAMGYKPNFLIVFIRVDTIVSTFLLLEVSIYRK